MNGSKFSSRGPADARRRVGLRAAVGCALLAALPSLVLPATAATAKQLASAKAAAPPKVLVVGDSLSAEYGLKRGTGWVSLLSRKLEGASPPARVVNASISGDTTSGGRSRLPALLKQHAPTHVVIELGGNDALRGLPLDMTERNLSEMTKLSQDAGAEVLIVGIQVPPNYGSAYGDRFSGLFEKVAKARNAAVMPFLLKGVADGPDALRLFQSDRIHPTEEAQSIMLANVWPVLEKLLR